MDYFFDKLSDRINASQDRGAGRDYEQSSQSQTAAPAVDNSELEKIIDERLALFRDQIVEDLKTSVVKSVNDSNSMYVEMITHSNDEGNTARLSATEEIMSALASTKNDLSDAISMNGHATKEELTEIITRLQDEYLTREDLIDSVAERMSASEEIMSALASTKNDLSDAINSGNYAVQESLTEIIAKQSQQSRLPEEVVSEIAEEVAYRVRQDQGAPISEEGIAEAVAAALAVSLRAPASKEEIAGEVADTLAETLDSHKLEISEIAEAVAEKVREDRTEPVSKEEIAQVVEEIVRENRTEPVSREEIARVVEEIVRENRTEPVSKEDIAAAVAADMAVTLAAQRLEISEIAEAVAGKVRENQIIPVSEEEIARILSEKIRENRVEPVSKEEIAQIVEEKVQENKVIPVSKEEIAGVVEEIVRENRTEPVSKEEIARVVEEIVRENRTEPVSKEDIAAAVAADMAVTLAAQKLEISDIAEAVAGKVRENQIVPVSEEEIARILSEKIRENRIEPVSKEEIAQIVEEKVQENKVIPVSKEEIAGVVEEKIQANKVVPVSKDEIARVVDEKIREYKSDILAALSVAKNELSDNIIAGFEKEDAGVAGAVNASGSAVKQELTETINRSTEELSDHMHKESVKVYKNVQAVLEESFRTQNEKMDADAASRDQNLRNVLDVSINSALKDNLRDESENTKKIVNDTVSSLLNTNTGEKLSSIKGMLLALICMLGINLLGIIVILLWIFQVI